MKTPARHTFYRKHTITTDGACMTDPHFVDMAVGDPTNYFTFKGGTGSNSYYISGAIPDSMNVGAGQLVGGDLVLHCSGVNVSNVGTLPEISAYNCVSGTTFTEGGMSYLTGSANDFTGKDMAVYTAFCDPTIYTYFEGFDGGDASIGNVEVSAPNKKLSDPFIDLGKHGGTLSKKLYAGGDYSWISSVLPSLTIESQTEGAAFYRKYYGTWEDGTRTPKAYRPPEPDTGYAMADALLREVEKRKPTVYNTSFTHLYLKPYDIDKIHDLWVPAFDYRGGQEQIHVFTPFWKFDDIKHLIEWGTITETPTATEGGDEDVNSNTTIFDSSLIYKTPNLQTYFGGGDPDALPIIRSNLSLSSEKYDSGGQALLMDNLWSYSNQLAEVDKLYGTTEGEYGVTSQYMCVGMRNVPFPIPLDSAYNAYSDQSTTSGSPYATLTTDNVSLPEINIKFCIDNMSVTPIIASSKGSSPKSVNGDFVDYISGAASTGNPYAEVQFDGTTSGSYSEGFRTLQRAFVIMFTNYPPNQGENLDAFIDRGMKDFYNGTEAGSKYLGGMVVFKDQQLDNTDADNSVVQAMPLQTAISTYAGETSATSGDIDMTRNRLLKFNTANGIGADKDAGAICFSALPAQNVNQTKSAAGSSYEHSVPLKIGNFVNAKFVFDVLGTNYIKNDAGTAGGERQNMARVFFTEGTADVLDTTDTQPTVVGGAATSADGQAAQVSVTSEVVPSFPIYFPCHPTSNGTIATDNSKTVLSWMAKPNLWPRYLTIWCTNLRQTNASNATTDTLIGETQPWSSYTSNLADFGFTNDVPEATGSDHQTKVFVDTISFSNFTNTVINASARAVGNSQSIQIKERGMTSVKQQPLDLGFSSTHPNSSSNPTMNGLGASTSGSALTGITDTLYERYMPTYLGLGFPNGLTDWSGSSGPLDMTKNIALSGAALLFNGFGSQGRDTMQWNGIACSLPFMSLGPDGNTWEDTDYDTRVFLLESKQVLYYGSWMYNMSQMWWDYDNDNNAVWNEKMMNAPFHYGGNVETDGDDSAASLGSYPHGFKLGSTRKNAVGASTQNVLWSDQLTQKGVCGLFMTSGAIKNHWAKREHPFFSAKITSIPSFLDTEKSLINEGNAFKVDNTSIFDMPLSDEFIIYKTPGIEGKPYNGTTKLLDPMSSDSYDYSYEDLSIEVVSKLNDNINEGGGTNDPLNWVEVTNTSASSYYSTTSAGGVIYPGAYMAITSGGTDKTDTVREIVKIESITLGADGGTTAAANDRWFIARAQMGTSYTTIDPANSCLMCPVHVAAIKGIKQLKQHEGGMVYWNTAVDMLVTEDNLPYLYISPYKYWYWLQLWPGMSDLPAINGAGGSAKSYASIVPLHETTLETIATGGSSVTGTTFAEADYFWDSQQTDATWSVDKSGATMGMAGLYGNIWNQEPSASGSVLDVTQDLGWGAYSEETRTGGEVDINQAKNAKTLYLNLDGYVSAYANSLAPLTPVVNKLVLSQPLSEITATFFGNDYTTTSITSGVYSGSTVIQEDVRPYYLWAYRDELPTVSNFKVAPAFNLIPAQGRDITDIYNLTDEDLNGVRFTWSEGADDIWYRLLFVDNQEITNKYHGFGAGYSEPALWMPLNEKPTVPTAAPTYYIYDTTTSSVGATGTVTAAAKGRASIEGLQGYCYDSGVSGTASITIANTASKMMSGSTKYSLMMHVTPHAGGTGTIFAKGSTVTGATITMDANGRVSAGVQGVTLQSVSGNPMDSQTPIAIMLVHNSGSRVPFKLYINGQLEDYVTSDTAFNAFTSGDSAYLCDSDASNSDPWDGKIEEVVLWQSEVFMPTEAGEYILNTADIEEFNSGDNTSYSLNGRLFLMDYHNIRGKNDTEVCSTPTVSWRATIA